jgi:molybdopterin-guanine dinucleotide biosynthesis protein A
MDKGSYLNGLVLAGGLSSRMGSDKALIDYHGKPQREYLFDALATLCHEVYTSCRVEHNVPPRLNPLPDVLKINSPLNGILTAFQTHPDRAWLAVAIDLPNVSASVLQELIAHRDVRKLATCFFDAEANAVEPLLTIWEPAARSLLAANAESGNVSPRSFLQQHDVNIVFGMQQSVFTNVNDSTARARWRSLE